MTYTPLSDLIICAIGLLIFATAIYAADSPRRREARRVRDARRDARLRRAARRSAV